MASDTEMRDAEAIEEDERQYGHGVITEEELNAKYPNRPRNHSKTLPFHELYLALFNPLNEHRKRPAGPVTARKKQGKHGPVNLSPHEIRRDIINRFISRWRKEVGNDIYPAFRLILPEKDRDRAMYGLREKTIGRILVKILRIDKDSEDGYNLLNWKLPGQNVKTAMAGDFAGRCFEVISKRPIRTTPGDMTIAEVNEMLDKLSIVSVEEDQRSVFEEFYRRMNAEELLWLIRMILRQMKIGATEKTIFDIWHPDAESLFNVSSSLRRVCWELYDPSIRLEGDDRGISLMQCFQPQLAAFQMHSFEKIVGKMKQTEDDDAFWIEEKLDGERMQLHMAEDDSKPGGKSFAFWSRKAKDYTYLYGGTFEDENSALTRHIKEAFGDGVRNIILDGEMITWDMEQDAMVPFGTLKAAALSEQRNPFSTGQRPLYRVFDCLYLNDEALTNYTLRDRRRALEASIRPIHRRLEIHMYVEAHSAAKIEPLLRQVVSEASEGLVIKNPRSPYRLNERNDDWIKVKPEYMTEFGEALDCIVIGGYYGSGHRGGKLSSFLCGLRMDQNQIQQGANPMKCFSFFKVGGGMTADDYATIRHHTDGKWHVWDPKKPPSEYIELAGGDKVQKERPDVWIRPDESVVFSVKAASVSTTEDYRMGLTLRFPRFKKLRTDKDWRSALSIQGFVDLKNNAEQEQKEKEFKVDDSRRKRQRITKKKPLTVVGSEEIVRTPYAGPATKVFEGLTLYIMTDSTVPERKCKAELEQLVKANGGKIVQKDTGVNGLVCVAEKRLVPVVSMQKSANRSIVRPSWLFDCIRQSEADLNQPSLLLPYEPNHMFWTLPDELGQIEANVDEYGDSFARDVTVDELRQIFKGMPLSGRNVFDATAFLNEAEDGKLGLGQLPGWMFHGLVVYFDKADTGNGMLDDTNGEYVQPHSVDLDLRLAGQVVTFAGGKLSTDLDGKDITHVVVGRDRTRVKDIRRGLQRHSPLPRIVTADWVHDSWKEKTLLDEERYAASP
ncbi:DNA ligase (ATP) [Coniosporium apollinis]|uniref:DNA ligase n=1 Tax=Coniosporium apollinis TaxID=61459 RepID=A0ABQ9NP65_9PEZI|nr:DNA ligase (ATP) [Coniosporium apollinis]